MGISKYLLSAIADTNFGSQKTKYNKKQKEKKQ